MIKTALITGIAGQDGAYLADFLLKKKYNIIGADKDKKKKNRWRLKKLGIDKKILFVKLDICNEKDLKKIFSLYKITEMYNLAANSFVESSFNSPLKTANTTGLSVLKILNTIKDQSPKTKFYQASSSEMYGNADTPYQSEKTSFDPQSPYAISKLFGHYITRYYRNTYQIFAVSGILFNHESPLRGDQFVTKKIIKGLVRIKKGKQDFIELGNLNSERDWGYAKEYVTQMWKMMQLKKADDFVIASGKTYSIRNFIDIATNFLNMETKWIGKNLKLKLINKKNNKVIIKINKKLFRPSEVNSTRGNTKKAKKFLKWQPKISLKKLIQIMIKDELNDYK